MLSKRERVKEIDTEILEHTEKIRQLESERKSLLADIHSDETIVLNKIPARARNALVAYCGIDSDFKLKCFLYGDSSVVSTNTIGFHVDCFDKADTYESRLATVPCIGDSTAVETVKILKQIEFLSL